jgi:hypothetical protein
MMMTDLLPPILYNPQFSRDDALKVCDISSGVLKGIIDRKQVTLRSEHNPGTGRRRMYTGGDILKINTANIANGIGFPLRWAYILADQVERRAAGKLTGTALENCKHFGMAFYPNKAGDDWAFVAIKDGQEATPLPIACQVIDVDRLIDETIAKLNAIVNDEPLPSFDIPEVKQEDPYSPENDFFGIWTKDEEGRNCLIGLTFDETAEFQRLQTLWLADASQDDDNRTVILSREDGARLRTLEKRHQRAHDASRLGCSEDELYDEDAE